MGFFSSRRTDEELVVNGRERSKTTATVVQVIRSRFYGKHRAGADSRAEAHSSTFVAHDGSAASILGHPGQSLRKTQSTPFSATIHKASGGSSRLKNVHTSSSSTNLRSTEPSNTRNSGLFESSGFLHVQTGTSTSKSTYGRPDAADTSSTVSANKLPPTPASTRASRTDNATMTLAQRLNELAVANEQGLLNDDEYRILRQNLFERFAGNATVPVEESIVPASVTSLRHPQKGITPASEGRTSFSSSRLSSNFNIDIAPNTSTASVRSPSIRSVRTGVTSLLHRATNRGSNRDKSDTSSIYSTTSTASNVFHSQLSYNQPHTRVGSHAGSARSLRKKTSNSSIGTEASISKKGQNQADSVSLSSRTSRKRTGLGFGQHPERSPSDGSYSPQTPSRSATSSLRRLAVPPSSFSPKGLHNSNLEPTREDGRSQDIFEDTNLVTSADLKREIAAVEAEGKRLVDAFNGLEVTTLAKRQRRHLGHYRVESRPATIVGLPGDGVMETPESGGNSASTEVGVASTWTLIPDNKLQFRATPTQTPTSAYLDTDLISIRSGTSAHTSHTGRSIPRSAHRDASRTLPSKPSSSSVSGPGPLDRKNSGSSLGSSITGKKRAGGVSPIPPLPSAVPPIPSGLSGLSNLALASGSSLNLARSTGQLPMTSVPEDEGVDRLGLGVGSEEINEEIRGIRKKKDDVSKRYEERLEYLRAKLKGAQLHEKLMKK
ncbi:hypothetical protein J3R30DRAFT_3402587 [Lentinula aciculospora]|uniref:Uncharacterized protein n=1 Tax=Lentinula aciculospora TaxID=153920 RepID=A0A9W9AHF6_9AGAR|nr:hypothetical protein J3R30DRAFT_3402587 [Lentinula aciculospora]